MQVVVLTGKQSNLATGTVTIHLLLQRRFYLQEQEKKLDIAVPTSINVKQWDGVVPGVSQTWTRIQKHRNVIWINNIFSSTFSSP